MLENLFILLFLIVLIALVVGLINPKWAINTKENSRFSGVKKTRGMVLLIYGSLAILLLALASAVSDPQARMVREQQRIVEQQQKNLKAATEAAEKQKIKDKETADKVALEKKRAQEAEEREQRERTQLLSAPVLKYQDIARYPDKNIGSPFQFFGKVVQVMEDGNKVQMRISTRQNSIGWYDDLVFVFYQMGNGEARILENDMLRVYGKSQGIQKYKTIMGNEVSLPSFDAKIISR